MSVSARALPLLLFALLRPSAAAAQQSVGVGAGFSAGLVGVEVLFRPGGGPLLAGAGAGIAGIGARAMLLLASPGEPSAEAIATRRYLSAEYLLTPWSFGSIDGTGAVGAEVGMLIEHPNGRIFADLAVGGAVPHGGSWGGNTLVPLVRLQLGLHTGH